MRTWPAVVLLPLLAIVVWLVWRVQDLPLQPDCCGGFLVVDSLSAFFMLLMVIITLGLFVQQKRSALIGLLALGLLLAAAGSASLFGVAGAYLLVTLLLNSPSSLCPGGGGWGISDGTVIFAKKPTPERRGIQDGDGILGQNLHVKGGWWSAFRTHMARLDAYLATPGAFWYAIGIWSLLPCVCLWIAYGGLATQAHTWRYTEPVVGTALNSFVFWFVLLATLLGSTLRVWDLGRPNGSPLPRLGSYDLLLTVAWFYPLARLYSLGPWNVGWHFAAILLGGAVALWAAWRATLAGNWVSTTRWLVQMPIGLALVGIGMGTSAGIVAGCYALLVAVLLSIGLLSAYHEGEEYGSTQFLRRQHVEREGEASEKREWEAQSVRWALWLLCGAIPLTAPFVAVWMALASAAAGGLFLLAGMLWIAALLSIFTTMRLTTVAYIPVSPVQAISAALASVALGVTSPLVLHILIRPVVQQLQGGLTPFGDIVVWPWGGLVALNSARQQVATLPSMTIFALMLVLGALAWLILRLSMALQDARK